MDFNEFVWLSKGHTTWIFRSVLKLGFQKNLGNPQKLFYVNFQRVLKHIWRSCNADFLNNICRGEFLEAFKRHCDSFKTFNVALRSIFFNNCSKYFGWMLFQGLTTWMIFWSLFSEFSTMWYSNEILRAFYKLYVVVL